MNEEDENVVFLFLLFFRFVDCQYVARSIRLLFFSPMQRVILLLILLAFIFNINARAFDNEFTSSSESDEVKNTYFFSKKNFVFEGFNELSSNSKKSIGNRFG